MLSPLLRRAAARAPAQFFVCNQCLRQAPRTALMPSSSTGSRILQQLSRRTFADKPAVSQVASAAAAAASQGAAKAAASNGFPQTTSKAVAYWLLASAVSVFGIVVWGGLTRLTESG